MQMYKCSLVDTRTTVHKTFACLVKTDNRFVRIDRVGKVAHVLVGNRYTTQPQDCLALARPSQLTSKGKGQENSANTELGPPRLTEYCTSDNGGEETFLWARLAAHWFPYVHKKNASRAADLQTRHSHASTR